MGTSDDMLLPWTVDLVLRLSRVLGRSADSSGAHGGMKVLQQLLEAAS